MELHGFRYYYTLKELTHQMTCKELKKLSRCNLKNNYPTTIIAFLTVTLISIAIRFPFILLHKTNMKISHLPFYIITELLICSILSVLSSGQMSLHLKLSRNEQILQLMYLNFSEKILTDLYLNFSI